MKTLKLKKLYAGCYVTKINGVEVELYKSEDGKYWNIIHGEFGTPEYWTDGANTKSEAVVMLNRFINKTEAV